MGGRFDSQSTSAGIAAPPPKVSGGRFDGASEPAGLETPKSAKPVGGFDVMESLFSGFNRGLVKVGTGLVDLSAIAIERMTAELAARGIGSPIDLSNAVGRTKPVLEALEKTGITKTSADKEPSPFVSRVGEVVGGAVPIAGVTSAASKGVTAITKGFTAPIREAARSAPGKFAAAELATSTGAGVGNAFAQEMFPGDPTAQIIGEMAGGIFNPAVLAAKLASSAFSQGKRAVSTLTKSGRQKAASETIEKEFAERGEVPSEVAAGIDGADPNLTPAAQTGSPTLLAIEQRVLNENSRLREAVDDKTAAALKEVEDRIIAIAGGDSVGEAESAQGFIRGLLDRLTTSIQTRIQQAAIVARMRVLDELPGSDLAQVRKQTSIETRDELVGALRDARTQETDLWNKVPDYSIVSSENTRDKFITMFDDLAEAQKDDMPAVAKRLLKREQDEDGNFEVGENQIGDETTVKELRGLRSKLLEISRKARSEGEFNKARIADEISDSILDDIGALPGDDVAVAREYSSALNANFRRGTVGKLLGYAKEGGREVAGGEVLPSTIGRGGAVGRTAAEDIQKATGFEGKGGAVAATERAARSKEAQTKFLQAVALQTADPDGNISPQALKTFLRQNDDALAEFPRLRESLKDAKKAAELIKKLERSGKGRIASLMDRQKSRAALFISEAPAKAFKRVFSSQRPVDALKQLTRMAAKDNTGHATSGLRAGLLNYAMNTARTTSGGKTFFNSATFSKTLFDPPSPTQPSVVRMALDEGLLSPEQAQGLSKVVERMQAIERQIASNIPSEKLAEADSALFDLVARVGGANIGGAAAIGGSTGAPLVAANRGSLLARKVTGTIPTKRVVDVIGAAIEDPKLMKILLLNSKSPKQAAALKRRLNAFLIDNAILLPGEAEEKN